MTVSGPLFDGRALDAIDRFEASLVDTMATEGEDMVRSNLDASLRNPTGRYRSRVTSAVSDDDAVVHDSGVIYGPWLEGVSRRNQTTRFKGYASFRRAAQRLNAEAERITERLLPGLIRGMGG